MDLISLIVFAPLAGAFLLVFFPGGKKGSIRCFTLLLTTAVFVVSLQLFASFEPSADMQFVRKDPWIPSLGISYYVGVDGLSLFLVLLVTFLMPITILSSFSSIGERVKEYHICMLLLESAMVGAFVALDLFLFYVFWEMMLIPMYFLIGMWGGERRIYATIKFFIYTMAGSLLMLVAILVLAYSYKAQRGSLTFELTELYGVFLTRRAQWMLFLAFALSFAIKVPTFPFHTWLPDAHVEAPTAGSVILAGVLLKMGTYGFLRFAMPLFPAVALKVVPYVVAISIVGIIYGACVVMVQKDVKKLVAYSSVSHLGFVMLGLFAMNVQAVEGAIYQMLNHGLSTGALFLLVGVIYERRHTRLIASYGGLTKAMPVYAAVFMIVTLSSIGLPPLNGFVGEFLILIGAFKASALWGVLAGTGVVLGAIYMLWMYQRVFLGPVKEAVNAALKDLSAREVVVFIPIILLIFLMGIYPGPFLSRIEPSVEKFIARIESRNGLAELGGAPDSVAMGCDRTGSESAESSDPREGEESMSERLDSGISAGRGEDYRDRVGGGIRGGNK